MLHTFLNKQKPEEKYTNDFAFRLIIAYLPPKRNMLNAFRYNTDPAPGSICAFLYFVLHSMGFGARKIIVQKPRNAYNIIGLN